MKNSPTFISITGSFVAGSVAILAYATLGDTPMALFPQLLYRVLFAACREMQHFHPSSDAAPTPSARLTETAVKLDATKVELPEPPAATAPIPGVYFDLNRLACWKLRCWLILLV